MSSNSKFDTPDSASSGKSKQKFAAKDTEVEVVRPDSTVTIKVTPDHRLFDGEGRQATAPPQRPALHVNPSRPVSGMDPHRTQQVVRRDACDAQQHLERHETAKENPNPKPDDEASASAELDGEQGMDTLALDDGMQTIIMEESGETLMETGWRCPSCHSPNRHTGAAADLVLSSVPDAHVLPSRLTHQAVPGHYCLLR